MTNKYLVIGAVAAGLGLVYLAKKGVEAVPGMVVDAVSDAATAVNPWNQNNVFNKGATSLYQAKTGSTGTLGTDIYDAMHGDRAKHEMLLNATNDYNPAVQIAKSAANGMEWLLKAVTGDEYEIDLQKAILDWKYGTN